MDLPEPGPHTDAVIAVLEGITVDGEIVPVEDVVVHPDTNPPYIVVQPSPGGVLDGPIGAPHDDGDLVVLVKYVTAVTPDRQGRQLCQGLQQVGQARLLAAGAVTVAGRDVQVRIDIPGGVLADPGPNPDRLFVTDRVVLMTTPA